MERPVKTVRPEFAVFVAESRQSFGSEIIYKLPVGVQRILSRVFPGNKVVQEAFKVTRMRIGYGLPRNPIPDYNC